jgi:hypothetical protein
MIHDQSLGVREIVGQLSREKAPHLTDKVEENNLTDLLLGLAKVGESFRRFSG